MPSCSCRRKEKYKRIILRFGRFLPEKMYDFRTAPWHVRGENKIKADFSLSFFLVGPIFSSSARMSTVEYSERALISPMCIHTGGLKKSLTRLESFVASSSLSKSLSFNSIVVLNSSSSSSSWFVSSSGMMGIFWSKYLLCLQVDNVHSTGVQQTQWQVNVLDVQKYHHY